MKAILMTLPDKSIAGLSTATEWQLSRKYKDFVSLAFSLSLFRFKLILLQVLDKQFYFSHLTHPPVFPTDFSHYQVPLGYYLEQRFAEPAVLQMIKDFQAELASLSVAIDESNADLKLPYTYLNPKNLENSISI